MYYHSVLSPSVYRESLTSGIISDPQSQSSSTWRKCMIAQFANIKVLSHIHIKSLWHYACLEWQSADISNIFFNGSHINHAEFSKVARRLPYWIVDSFEDFFGNNYQHGDRRCRIVHDWEYLNLRNMDNLLRCWYRNQVATFINVKIRNKKIHWPHTGLFCESVKPDGKILMTN